MVWSTFFGPYKRYRTDQVEPMRIQAIKARHGDAIIVTTDQVTILVDGGPSSSYDTWLAELKALPRDGVVDLLMISHIDADHIGGVLKLTDSLVTASQQSADPVVKVREVWHNSFTDMVPHDSTIGQAEPAATRLAATFAAEYGLAADDGAAVLASVAQGKRLSEDVAALEIDRNRRFQHAVVAAGGRTSPWSKQRFKISVLGPGPKQITDLQNRWRRDLTRLRAKEAAVREAAAAGLDRSVTNIASIVALVTDPGGAQLLLTGDARGDLICEALEDSGLPMTNGAWHFNVVKLPHHGSNRNISPDFYDRVRADHYIVSGNGGHGNPEPDALRDLFETRPKLDYLVHMTYSPTELCKSDTYCKHHNDKALTAMLTANQEWAKVLRFPAPGENFVEVQTCQAQGGDL